MNPATFPNESEAYRQARNDLLAAESELRAQIERVAQQRRNLPEGGLLKEDYEFDEMTNGQSRKVRFSELFGDGRDDLFIYSFMFSEAMDQACPMCTAMLDSLDGQIQHLNQRINTAVVARHDIRAIREFADQRGWRNLRLISSAGNSYNADYYGESPNGQIPFANAFVRRDGRITHFWGTELLFQPSQDGQHMRHIDMIWPIWNVLDMTAGGRGTDWLPSLQYP